MTRVIVTSLIALTIFVAVECLAQSLEDADTDQRDDLEVPAADDIDRGGSAHAYVSVTRLKPVSGQGPPIKFVNCFSCVDCPKAMANTSAKYCPYTNDPTKNNKCVVYAEKYIQMKKLWYVRGCASERGSCADIKRGHDNSQTVQLSLCHECEGDRCNTNGVSRINFDITTALLVLILCPVLGKLILS